MKVLAFKKMTKNDDHLKKKENDALDSLQKT